MARIIALGGIPDAPLGRRHFTEWVMVAHLALLHIVAHGAKCEGTEFPGFVRHVKFCKDVAGFSWAVFFAWTVATVSQWRHLVVRLPRTIGYGRLHGVREGSMNDSGLSHRLGVAPHDAPLAAAL